MVFVHHTKDLKFPHFKIRRTKSSNSCLRSRNTRYNKLGKKLYTKIGKPRFEALVNKHKYTTTKKKKKIEGLILISKACILHVCILKKTKSS